MMPRDVEGQWLRSAPLQANPANINQCPECGGPKTKASKRCLGCAHTVNITERDFDIFAAREGDGRTFMDISAEYGVTSQAIQAIARKTYRRLLWL